MRSRLLLIATLLAAGCNRAPEAAPEPVVATTAEPAPAPAPASPVTCALIDAGKLPQAALLEARLLDEKGATWVDRTNIDAVLKEQQLQAAFGPQGVSDRVKLGKLLKADVLVLVRPVKDAKEPAIEVIVSETAGGLRLLVRGIAITRDSAADVDALAAAVKDGLTKHGEAIREVVAVPPFVSNDFEYAFDHLKGAFAKLAEAEALNRPGVVVVELEEAQAVAKEVTLAGETLKRPLPVYLLGEYRHEGKGADRTVSLKLRAERGGKPVAAEANRTVKADESPVAVRAWAASTLDGLAKDAARPPSDPKAEASVLASRARVFKRIGNWAEALGLFEAALLLDPTRNDVRIDILKTAEEPLKPASNRMAYERDLAATEFTTRLYLRALDHLEGFILHGGDVRLHQPVGDYGPVTSLRTAAGYLKHTKFQTPKQMEIIREAQAREREVFRRLIPRLYHLDQQVFFPFVAGFIMNLPDPEKLGALEQMIRDLPADSPRSVIVAGWLGEHAVNWRKDAAFAAFRKTLESGTTPIFRAAAAGIPGRIKAAEALEAPYVPPVRASASNPDRIKMSDIPLELDGTPPKPFSSLGPGYRMAGVLKLGPATDLFWGPGFYLMKTPGRLRPVNDLRNVLGAKTHIRFDGKYVWISSATFGPGNLYLLDPETEKVWSLSNAEGLPRPAAADAADRSEVPFPLAALGPGRVCLAGRIGKRAWVGVAEFDPSKGSATVKLVAECREAEDTQNPKQWASPELGFTPSWAHALAGAKGSTPRVLVGRSQMGTSLFYGQYHPLVVDPSGSAKPIVLPDRMGLYELGRQTASLCGEQDGRVYFLEHEQSTALVLRRIGLPGPTIDTIADGFPQGTFMLMPFGDRWHAIELLPGRPNPERAPMSDPFLRNWWLVDPGEKTARLAATDMPVIQSLAVSAHYGLVALVARNPDSRVAVCRVDVAKFDPSKASTRTLSRKHPEEEKGVKSAASTVESTMVVVNSGSQAIRLHWIGFDGVRKSYGDILPGKRFEQKTFVGHVWIVTDADDNAWRLIRPEAKPKTFEITGPEKP